MTVIVDASIATKWYIAEADSDLSQRLIEAGHELIAPDLLLVEVANALFKAWRRGAVDEAHMDLALAQLPRAISNFYPLSELVADAMVIARILRHPVYDCTYLALAWRAGGHVVTADQRFVQAAKATSWEHYVLHLRDVA